MATTKTNKQIQNVIDDIKIFEKQVGLFKDLDIENEESKNTDANNK